MHYFNIFLFIFIFLFLGNLVQLTVFISNLFRPNKVSHITDTWISKVIKKKTGLEISEITIFEDEILFGLMAGTSSKPYLILSRGAYKLFTKDELEWLVLHEAAHAVLKHTYIFAGFQMLFLLLGIIISNFFNTVFMSLIISICLAIMYVQIAKRIEYEADVYAISRVDNPHGVISAQKKFIEVNKINEKSIFRKLISWNISTKERIRLAENRLRP